MKNVPSPAKIHPAGIFSGVIASPSLRLLRHFVPRNDTHGVAVIASAATQSRSLLQSPR